MRQLCWLFLILSITLNQTSMAESPDNKHCLSDATIPQGCANNPMCIALLPAERDPDCQRQGTLGADASANPDNLSPPRSITINGEEFYFQSNSQDPDVKQKLARAKLRRTGNDKSENYEDTTKTVQLSFDAKHLLRSVTYFSGISTVGVERGHSQYLEPLPILNRRFPVGIKDLESAFGKPSSDVRVTGLCMVSWSFLKGTSSWGPAVYCDNTTGEIAKFSIDGGLATAALRSDTNVSLHKVQTDKGGRTYAIEGKYKVAGRDRLGNRYYGTCSVKRSGENKFDFLWHVGKSYRGTGGLSGTTLTVNWGAESPAIYKLAQNGALVGSWDNGRASETLIPIVEGASSGSLYHRSESSAQSMPSIKETIDMESMEMLAEAIGSLAACTLVNSNKIPDQRRRALIAGGIDSFRKTDLEYAPEVTDRIGTMRAYLEKSGGNSELIETLENTYRADFDLRLKEIRNGETSAEECVKLWEERHDTLCTLRFGHGGADSPC